MTGQIKDATRSFVSDDSPRMRNYSGMLGRISLAELKVYLAEHAPDTPDDEVMLNWATVSWEDDATPDELAKRVEWRRRRAERLEAWERETLARLLTKYPQEGTS
jgi:hypothetical protein